MNGVRAFPAFQLFKRLAEVLEGWSIEGFGVHRPASSPRQEPERHPRSGENCRTSPHSPRYRRWAARALQALSKRLLAPGFPSRLKPQSYHCDQRDQLGPRSPSGPEQAFGSERHVSSWPRLYKNVRGRGTRRIVFSIIFSQQSSQVFAFFKLMKSRRTFYRKFQFRSFHTAKDHRDRCNCPERASAFERSGLSQTVRSHALMSSCTRCHCDEPAGLVR